MTNYANLVEEVYLSQDDAPDTIGDYVPMTNGDIFSVFVNDNNKEMVYTTRGIMLNNKQDVITLMKDIIPQYQGGLRSGNKNIGDSMTLDLMEIEDNYLKNKKEYPDYKHVFTGHSRGGGLSLALGRKHNEETHAYAPISSKVKGRYNEDAVYDPKKIHIYYTAFDVAPKFLREQALTTNEQHHLIPLKKDIKETFISKGHSIDHFTSEEIKQDVKQDIKQEIKQKISQIKRTPNEILNTFSNRYSQDKLYKIFKKVDKNNDGLLDADELANFYRELMLI